MAFYTERQLSENDVSSESDFNDENFEDLSCEGLKTFPEYLISQAKVIEGLQLSNNFLSIIPNDIAKFSNLVLLDISNNFLKVLNNEICMLPKLQTFIAKNNQLATESLPKDFGILRTLEVVNLSGNQFTSIPIQLTELESLRCLYLGSNQIDSVPSLIKNMKRLEVLYLGGNRLTYIPPEVGQLQSLTSLILCNNLIQALPESLANLVSLQSLSLHDNNISTLPHRLISLNLVELSLRNNPLVVKFVSDMTFDPPSLMELTGRTVLSNNIRFTPDDVPRDLIEYLRSANHCVNPKCKGVFFTSRVEHVKFVDFCGKYRLPLLEYLCSPRCTVRNPHVRKDSESSDDDISEAKMKKVLLG